jgi:Zn-dependent M28 family amino/carboxypeptidase
MRASGVLAGLVVGGLALLAFVFVPFRTSAPDSVARAAVDSIGVAHLEPHVRFLASDGLEGRAPATRGGALAADYLAAQLALAGVEPAGDGGTYFQQVRVVESVTLASSTATTLTDGSVLRPGADIVAFSGRTEAHLEVRGEVVFVGHGIVAPEFGWDDYANVNLAGRIALVMVGEPGATPEEPDLFAGDALTYYGRWTYKLEEAARHGASGALLIHTDASATYPWSVVQASWGGTQYALEPGDGRPGLPDVTAWVTDDAARRLARAGGYDLDVLRTSAMQRGARPQPLGTRLAVSLRRTVSVSTSPNVIGRIPGREADRGVLLTAHYDHLGVRVGAEGEDTTVDRVFNGAVDNASGVGGVLAMASALARAGVMPRRSIYVLFTTAEESGLLGASHFASRLPLPAGRWAANVNVDELNVFGPSREVVLVGSERSSIRDVAVRVAARRGREIVPDPNPAQGGFFRSDHFPFARLGIPAVSTGLPSSFIGADREAARQRLHRFTTRDYHQPGDEVREDWDFTSAVADLHLLGDLVWALADDATVPAYRTGDPFVVAEPRPAAP